MEHPGAQRFSRVIGISEEFIIPTCPVCRCSVERVVVRPVGEGARFRLLCCPGCHAILGATEGALTQRI